MEKILFISHSPKFAGAEQFLLEIMCNLRDSFEVHLLCPGKGRLVEGARRAKIPTHIIPYFWFLTPPSFFWTQLAFLPANLLFFFAMVRFLRKLHCDLVYTNTCVAPSGPLAAKLCGIPHVWHMQEAFGQGSYEYGFPFLGQKTIAKMILKLSDAVIVCSKYIREYFPRETAKNIFVVYHGFSPSVSVLPAEAKEAIREHCGIGVNDIVLSVVGSLQKRKGQLWAIRAMPSILKKHPSAKLLIAGKYTVGSFFYKKTIESEVKANRLEQSVKFLGDVSDVSRIYQITDILLVPSLYEPLGRTMTEAALHKVPCIASDVGGIPEVIENDSDGILILPGDSAAIAGAVLALLEDRHKMKALGENAFLRIPPRFVMTDTVQKIANIINQTLETADTTKKSVD